MMQFHGQTKLRYIQSKSNVLSHCRIIVRGNFINITICSSQQLTPIVRVWVPVSIPILRVECFNYLGQFHSISFERGSKGTHIESFAFLSSTLQSILVPCSVETLGRSCVASCISFPSISFNSPSRLRRIESSAFFSSSPKSIAIPRSVQFIQASPYQIVMMRDQKRES
jgi:hypothetical protein